MNKTVIATSILLLLFCQLDAQIAKFIKYNSFPEGVREINCLYPQNDSVLWVGSNINLMKINGKNIREYKDTNNIAKFTINRIVEDKNNNIWLGNYLSTLLKVGISAQHTSEVRLTELLSEPQLITSMFTKDELIWAGTSEGKVFWYNINTEEADTIPLPVESEIYSLFADDEQRLWICTDKGLYHSTENEKWKKVKHLTEAYRIEYRNGTYWIVGKDANNHTVLMFSDYNHLLVFGFDVVLSSWTRLLLQGIPDVYVKYNDIDFDSNGNIWIAYDDGLIRYNPYLDDFDDFNEEKYPKFDLHPIRKVSLQTDQIIWVSSIDEIIKIVLEE